MILVIMKNMAGRAILTGKQMIVKALNVKIHILILVLDTNPIFLKEYLIKRVISKSLVSLLCHVTACFLHCHVSL